MVSQTELHAITLSIGNPDEMNKHKDPKSTKKSIKKTSSKKETKEEENSQGGIPDMDFKKLLGCG